MTDRQSNRQTTDHATEKWVAIGEIACTAMKLHALQKAISPKNRGVHSQGYYCPAL